MQSITNDVGLSNGKTITVKATAENEVGVQSTLSNPSVNVVKAQSAPTVAPTFSVQTIDDDHLVIDWTLLSTDSDIGYSAITNYHVWINNGQGGALYTLAGTTDEATDNFNITSLTPGYTYLIKMSAENKHGEGIKGAAVTQKTYNVPSRPAAPTTA